MSDEKTVAIYNRGARPFLVEYDKAKGYKKFIEPGTQAILPADQAAKLLKTYKRDLIKVGDIPKTPVASIKEIKDRDEKIAALQAKIMELEATIKGLLAKDTKAADAAKAKADATAAKAKAKADATAAKAAPKK